MQKADVEIKRIPNFGYTLLEKAQKITDNHDNPPTEITIKAVDDLIADATFLGELVDDLHEISKTINKMIMTLEQKGGSYLKVLKREDYQSPAGTIQVGGKWAVRMPKDDEAKAALFQHLRERELFDRYATVNSRSLNALYMADWKAAIKKDPEAWVLFDMPGVPAPVFDEFTKIKGNNSRKTRKDETDGDE